MILAPWTDPSSRSSPTTFKQPLERPGYVYRADNPERTKRYFREPPGRRRTHVHVRRAGSFSDVIRRADEWAQAQGWLPGPSNA